MPGIWSDRASTSFYFFKIYTRELLAESMDDDYDFFSPTWMNKMEHEQNELVIPFLQSQETMIQQTRLCIGLCTELALSSENKDGMHDELAWSMLVYYNCCNITLSLARRIASYVVVCLSFSLPRTQWIILRVICSNVINF